MSVGYIIIDIYIYIYIYISHANAYLPKHMRMSPTPRHSDFAWLYFEPGLSQDGHGKTQTCDNENNSILLIWHNIG